MDNTSAIKLVIQGLPKFRLTRMSNEYRSVIIAFFILSGQGGWGGTKPLIRSMVQHNPIQFWVEPTTLEKSASSVLICLLYCYIVGPF